jgi:ABC-type ATPase with predicted acetyltransferase domain
MGMVGEIRMEVEACFPASAVCASARTAAVAGMFGVPLRGGVRRVFGRFAFTLRAGTVTLITGPSGAGKSTLLRCVEEGLRGRIEVVRLEEIALPVDRAVVDCFELPLEETLGCLARAGLSEAHVLLRAPAELSEGQRFRYRLAQFFASEADVLIADEFAATLDRITARILSWQLAKFIHAGSTCAIVATTHDDLAGDLASDVTIYKGLGEEIRMTNDE